MSATYSDRFNGLKVSSAAVAETVAAGRTSLSFSGNNFTSPVTLTHPPLNDNLVELRINGISQRPETFVISGLELVPVDGWPSGYIEIEVVLWGAIDLVAGVEGVSAYEEALAGGYVGTAAEWLISLEGDDGAQGPVGPQGVVGPSGPQGVAGVTGPIGPNGADGADGTSVTILGTLAVPADLPASGSLGDAYLISGDLHVWDGSAWQNVGTIQGPAGPQGIIGATGLQGPVGADGATGPQGIEGPTGPAGTTNYNNLTNKPVIQTTSTDTTGNALLRLNGTNGAFGLGAFSCPNIIDMDSTTTRAGFYSSLGEVSTSGTYPSGASTFGAVTVIRYNSTNFVQIYYGVTTDGLWTRRYRSEAGGFQPWERIDNPTPRTEIFSAAASVVLTQVPTSFVHIQVFFDGIMQNPDTYTLATKTVNFTAGNPVGISSIFVRYSHY